MPIYYSEWESNTWKNILSEQVEIALTHSREVINENYAGPHNSIHIAERALVLSGFCIRRMIEKKLVTDLLADSNIELNIYPVTDDIKFRPPFHSSSGGNAFNNYLHSSPKCVSLKLKGLADEIIHSSQLMFVGSETYIQDGILIASDWHQNKRIIHITFEEFRVIANLVLDDRIVASKNYWDPDTGKILSIRD